MLKKVFYKFFEYSFSFIPSIIIIFMIFHVKAFLKDPRYDDGYFYLLSNKYNYIDFILMRYLSWSGRIIGDSLSYFLSIFGIWSYRINAIFCYFLTIISICKIANGRINKKCWLMASSFFGLIFYNTLTSAVFWFNGSSYYLVPVSFGLYIISVFTDLYLYSKNRLSFGKIIFIIISVIITFFSNEQMSIVVFFISSFLCLYGLIKRKQFSRFLILIQLGMVICLAISFLSPGNSVRLKSEEHWYPGFGIIPLTSKFKVGIYWLFDILVNRVLIFSYIPLYIIYIYSKKNGNNFVCLSVLSFQLGLILVGKLLVNSFINLTGLFDFNFIKDVYLESVEYTIERLGFVGLLVKFYPYIFWGVYYFNIFYLLVKISKHKFFIFLMLISGFGSLIMLWFSPTIFVSGNRVIYVYSVIAITIFTSIFCNLKVSRFYTYILMTMSISNLISIYLNWINYGFKIFY